MKGTANQLGLNPKQVRQCESRSLWLLLLAAAGFGGSLYFAFVAPVAGLCLGVSSLILGWRAAETLAAIPDLLQGANESF